MTTSASASRPLRAGALGLLLAVLITLLTAVPGSAHNELTESSPADGDSGPAPTDVVLTFSGEIAPVGAAVEVSGPDGLVSEGAAAVDGESVTQTLAANLPAGDYRVTWRVTSSDGHPISGEYGFTVQEPAPVDDATQTQPPGPGDDVAGTDDSATTEDGSGATTDDGSAGATEETDTATETGAVARASEDAADGEDSDGIPAWSWIIIALALLGLGAVVLRAVRNSR